VCLYKAGGWDTLVAKLPAASFSLTTIGWDTIITYFLIYFFGILIGQDIWQRVFTARDEKSASAPAPPPVSTACCTAWPAP
jgi:SSS family solute:Na+ symporter